jgi:hypothetical protein
MNKDVWLIILGAILAFGGGLSGFFIQWWWNRRNQKRIVYEFLKELLRVFNRTSPRIIETYEKSGILWNDLLNQVLNDLATYERNKEHTIVIEDFALRAKIWDLFSNIRSVTSMCLGLNNILLHQSDNTWAKDQVQNQVLKIKELATEAQILLNKLER